MASRRDTIREISPPWLQDGIAEKLLYVVGLVSDMLLEKADQAIKAWMPGHGTPTALPYLGADREIQRGIAETDDSYAARVQRAFDSWRHAGAPWGVLDQTLGYFSGFAVLAKYVKNGLDRVTNVIGSNWDIYAAGADTTEPPAHSRVEPRNWNWDGYTDDWFRRWLIFYPPAELMGPARKWDDGWAWDDGTVWDATVFTADQATTLKAIVKKWKSAGTYVHWIIFSFDAALFDETKPAGDPSLPDGTWGDWHKTVTLGDGRVVAVPSRSASAIYATGVV